MSIQLLNNERIPFDLYKSNVCHHVKNVGDMQFIADILQSDEIWELYQKGWYQESLYLLAMVDYLSRENHLPLCVEYESLRKCKLDEPVFSESVLWLYHLSGDEKYKKKAIEEAIPEFMRFNIVEGDIRNVC